jgi:hypothetical protein
MHSRYEWKHRRGTCEALLVAAFKLTPGAGFICELLMKSESFNGFDFDESLIRMLSNGSGEDVATGIPWFDREGEFSYTTDSLKATMPGSEGIAIAERLLRRVNGRGSDVGVDMQEVFRMNAWPRSTGRMSRDTFLPHERVA